MSPDLEIEVIHTVDHIMPFNYAIIIYLLVVSAQQVVGPQVRRRLPWELVQAIRAMGGPRQYSRRPSSSLTRPGRDHYTTDLGLLLAELQSRFTATREAQRFFLRASKYGLPSYDNLYFRDNHVFSYEPRLKQAAWVLDHVTDKRLDLPEYDDKVGFVQDPEINSRHSATNRDYTKSGYDRGHLSPACQHRTDVYSLEECYELSNVAPQKAYVNRGVWSKLEEYVYMELPTRSKNIYVVTGAYVLGHSNVRYDVIGPSRVAVPTHFYKVILYEPKYPKYTSGAKMTMEAFIVPNFDRGPSTEESIIDDFRIDIERDLWTLEHSTGLTFFDKLDMSTCRDVYGHKINLW